MWGKSTAAALLGLPFSVALIGLIALSLPGDVRINTLPMLLLFFPAAIAIISAVFAFRSGRRAWLSMSVANLVAWGLLYALKAAGVIGVPAP